MFFSMKWVVLFFIAGISNSCSKARSLRAIRYHDSKVPQCLGEDIDDIEYLDKQLNDDAVNIGNSVIHSNGKQKAETKQVIYPGNEVSEEESKEGKEESEEVSVKGVDGTEEVGEGIKIKQEKENGNGVDNNAAKDNIRDFAKNIKKSIYPINPVWKYLSKKK